MNPLKSITLKWWQASLFKLGIWALGIAVGAYWPIAFSADSFPELLVVGALCLWYITLLWWQQ